MGILAELDATLAAKGLNLNEAKTSWIATSREAKASWRPAAKSPCWGCR